MKTKSLSFLTTLLLGLCLAACQKATFVTPEKSVVTMGREGGSATIAMKSDATNFKVERAPEWVDAKMDGTMLSLTAKANDTQAPREDNVVVSCGGISTAITITQAYKTTFITPEKTSVSFGKEGGTESIKIASDGAVFDIDAPEGITAQFASGVLTVTAAPNKGKAISGSIKLAADEAKASISVSVKGNVCATCKGKGRITCPKCHGLCYYGDFVDCERCGGTGLLQTSATFYRYIESGGKTASGKIKCPSCGGKGV